MKYQLDPKKLAFQADKRMMILINDMVHFAEIGDVAQLSDSYVSGMEFVRTLFFIDVLDFEEMMEIKNELFELKWNLVNEIQRREVKERRKKINVSV